MPSEHPSCATVARHQDSDFPFETEVKIIGVIKHKLEFVST